MRTKHTDHGFTLMELMVTVAIIGILAALALNGLSGLRPKAKASTFKADMVGVFDAARNQAMADNAYVFVRWISSGSWKGYVMCEDTNGNYAPPLTTYAWATPCGTCTAANCPAPKLLERNQMPVGIDPVAGSAIDTTSLATLATPFHNVLSATTISGSGASFAPAGKFGYVEFLPRGEVRLSDGSQTGGALAFRADEAGHTDPAIQLVIITAPFGLIGSFDAN